MVYGPAVRLDTIGKGEPVRRRQVGAEHAREQRKDEAGTTAWQPHPALPIPLISIGWNSITRSRSGPAPSRR